jgi:hypothetical protein
MAAVSIRMLREENDHIPIRVFLVQDERKNTVFQEGMVPVELSTTEFAGICSVMGAEVHCVEPLEDEPFRAHHKKHLGECLEESVLCLDADTFVFSDIEWLFDEYANFDVVAARSAKPDEEVFFSSHHPGVVLWNKGWAMGWAKEPGLDLNHFIAMKGLDHGYFAKYDCNNLQSENEIEQAGQSVVVHSKTSHWQQVHSSLFGLPSKMGHRYLPRSS